MINLQKIIEEENIELIEMVFKGKIKGLYCDNVIAVHKGITSIEKRCMIGEELGHHFTSSGDIIDQANLKNIKQERKARVWGYEKLVPLQLLVEAINYPCQSKTDLAEYLDVTEEHLENALRYYKSKYGIYAKINEYTIMFEPLKIIKMFK